MRTGLDGLLAALQGASCGAYAVRLDQTIVFWNRAAERMLGHRAEDVIGGRCRDISGGAGLAAGCEVGCASLTYVRAGVIPAPMKLNLLCSYGERKWVLVTPVVVAGADDGSPLIVYLLEDSERAADPSHVEDTTSRHALQQGADSPPDRPQDPVEAVRYPRLSRRELEVLRLVARGWGTERIAAELGISRNTVRNHVRNLRHKLEAKTMLDAVVKGVRLGLIHMT